MLERGDPVAAIAKYRESLVLTRELDEGHLASRTLDRLGVALHQTGASRQAARLSGAAASFRESIGDTLFLEEDANLRSRFQQIRDALNPANTTRPGKRVALCRLTSPFPRPSRSPMRR